MRRRDIILGMAGTALALPRPAMAQSGAGPRRITILVGGRETSSYGTRVDMFRSMLASLGWREGVNLQVDQRWIGRDPATVRAIVDDVVATRPDVILAGPSNVVIPLKAATRTIPIVFVMVSDPVGQGVVDSIARPTGNATGFSNLEFSILGKWIDILKGIAPATTHVGLMISTINAASPVWYRTLTEIARKADVTPIATPIRVSDEIEGVFERLAAEQGSGLIVAGDTLVNAAPVRRQIIDLAAATRLPVVFASPEFVREGGLASYGIDETEPFRLAAGYVDRILKGEKPSDLPVQMPTRFRFAVNLRTAKRLGLSVPLALQVAADEVIE